MISEEQIEAALKYLKLKAQSEVTVDGVEVPIHWIIDVINEKLQGKLNER